MAAGRRGSKRAQQEAAKVRPEATADAAARPRQQARGPKADNSGKSGSSARAVAVSEAQVLAAVESLYADELKPVGRILKKRIAELRSTANQEVAAAADIEQLRNLCSASSLFSPEPEEGGDFFAMLTGREHSFVDIYDDRDVYPAELWSELRDYCESPLGQEMCLPGGRYACAQALHTYKLPCLVDYSLGRICHIVQLAITQKKILGYLNGAVVAYGKSQSKLKEHLAQTGHPVAPTDHAVDTIPVASLNDARSCMQQILRDAAGQVPLSNVKRFFRSKCNSELSETSLGYAKLSELLRGPHFQDICTVELRESGYVVIEVECASGSSTAREVACASGSSSARGPGTGSACSERQASSISGDEGQDAVLSDSGELEQEKFCPDQPLNFEEARFFVAPARGGQTGARAAGWKPLTPGTIAKEGYVIHNTFFDVAPALPTPIRKDAARRAKSLPKDVGCMSVVSKDDAASIDLAAAQPARTPRLISPSLVSPGRFWPPSPEVIDDSQNSFVWSMPWTQPAAYEPTAYAMGFADFVHPQPPAASLGSNSSFLYIEQHI